MLEKSNYYTIQINFVGLLCKNFQLTVQIDFTREFVEFFYQNFSI